MRSDQRPRERYAGNRPFQPQQRSPQRNQPFDSNGPNLKIRGSASQIFERYVALAREAATSGDPVAAENFYQHAEHYFRVSKENREGKQQGLPPRPNTPADIEMNPSAAASSDAEPDEAQARGGNDHRPREEPSIR
jgi:hypothetical protein